MIAASLPRFLEAPLGRFVRGRTWISAAPAPTLHVTLLGGRPREDEVRDLGRTYARRPGARPRSVLFDASRVVALEAAAHDALVQQLGAARDAYAHHVERVAVVHGSGMTGALFAGYPNVLGLAVSSRTFTDTKAALDWLDVGDGTEGEVLHLAESLLRDSVERVRLSVFLEEQPTASLHDAARALAIAPRTLQRSLERRGTSFRHEIDRARWGRATKALRARTGSITQVAFECGFGSLQAFSSWFRALGGVSPRAFRDGVQARPVTAPPP